MPPGSSACTVLGLRVRRWSLAPAEVQDRGRLPVTSPLRTALDIGRETGPVEESVAVVDGLVATAGSRSGGYAARPRRPPVRGAAGPRCRRARRVVGLADGLAGSPQETRLRLLLHSSPLPRPVALFVVRTADGRFVARVDFVPIRLVARIAAALAG